MAAQSLSNEEIASKLNTSRQIVSKWHKRFYFQRLMGLDDKAPGADDPGIFPPAVVIEVKALAFRAYPQDGYTIVPTIHTRA